MLTDEEIQTIFKDLLGYFMAPTVDDKRFARAIETAATEPLLQRIAELERKLEEARSLLAISCNRHALIALRNDADRYRWLRVSDKSDDAIIGMDCRGVFVKQREALDAAIDAAMKGTP